MISREWSVDPHQNLFRVVLPHSTIDCRAQEATIIVVLTRMLASVAGIMAIACDIVGLHRLGHTRHLFHSSVPSFKREPRTAIVADGPKARDENLTRSTHIPCLPTSAQRERTSESAMQMRCASPAASCHSYCCNNFNAAIAASFNPRQSDDRVAPVQPPAPDLEESNFPINLMTKRRGSCVGINSSSLRSEEDGGWSP
jgi:hypothetical protein